MGTNKTNISSEKSHCRVWRCDQVEFEIEQFIFDFDCQSHVRSVGDYTSKRVWDRFFYFFHCFVLCGLIGNSTLAARATRRRVDRQRSVDFRRNHRSWRWNRYMTRQRICLRFLWYHCWQLFLIFFMFFWFVFVKMKWIHFQCFIVF